MKKFVLCLLACLMLFSAAQAQESVMMEHGNTFFAADLVAVSDRLYMLAEQDGGVMTIASWQNGQATPDVASTLVNYALYMNLADAVAVDDGSRIVTMLFTDGSRLMSFDPVLGVVFELSVRDGAVTFSDVAAVREPNVLYWDAYGYTKSLVHAAVGGNTLYWLATEWDENGVENATIYTVDLINGAVSQLPLKGVTDFEMLPDNKMIVLQDASALGLYDPASGVLEPIGELVTEVYDILYAPSADAVIYLENQRVMGLSGMETMMQFAYSPVEPIDAAIWGDCIAVTDGANTIIRGLTENYQPACELTVMSGGFENQTAVRRYNADHPDTAVYWYQDYSGYLYDNSYEALVPVLEEQQLDIAVVTINASGFDALVRDGYAADLSGYDALVSRLNAMYPAYREAAASGGSYVAVPLGASSWGWYYDPLALSRTSLTAADLPTNLIDLCAFVTRWNNELMTLYPDVPLFTYVEDTRSYILGAMMEQYGVWCEKQYGALTFETPEFRSLLAAVDAMECDRIDRAAAESFSYEGGLIGNDFASIGSFTWKASEAYGYAAWLPMSLTAETERVEPTALEVAFVNAACEDPDAAAQLLTYLLDSLPAETAHTLFMDKTEPVANSDYAVWLAEANDYLNQMIAERANAGSRVNEYDEIIAAQQYYIEKELPLMEWTISAEDIAFYQTNIAPYARVIRANCISNWLSESYTKCYELIEKHVRGEITPDQFIRELDAIR